MKGFPPLRLEIFIIVLKRIFILSVVLIFPLALSAEPSLQRQVLAGLAQNAGRIEDLSAGVTFRIRVRQLGLAFRVTGNFYYKQPDKIRIKLNNVPAFLTAHQDVMFRSADVVVGLPRDIASQYRVTKMNRTTLAGRPCYSMALTPNDATRRVSKVYLWVSPYHYTIPMVVFQYHDGSEVKIKNDYQTYGNFFLVQEMQTVYDFTNPRLEADVVATFGGFRVNQGIPDAVFDDAKSNS